MIGEPPICMWCKHYRWSSGAGCKAFPDGIPDEIWYSCNPHTEPLPGDHGVQFEPIDPPANPARVRSRRR